MHQPMESSVTAQGEPRPGDASTVFLYVFIAWVSCFIPSAGNTLAKPTCFSRTNGIVFAALGLQLETTDTTESLL